MILTIITIEATDDDSGIYEITANYRTPDGWWESLNFTYEGDNIYKGYLYVNKY